jgi:hypothetical protein
LEVLLKDYQLIVTKRSDALIIWRSMLGMLKFLVQPPMPDRSKSTGYTKCSSQTSYFVFRLGVRDLSPE